MSSPAAHSSLLDIVRAVAPTAPSVCRLQPSEKPAGLHRCHHQRAGDAEPCRLVGNAIDRAEAEHQAL